MVKVELVDVKLRAAEVVTSIDALEQIVDDFLATSGMSQTRFGKLAVGDQDFVPKLKRGRKVVGGGRRPCTFTTDTVRKAAGFIRDWRG